MAFSEIGRKKVASHILLLTVDIVVLVFATRVNNFNEFFYAADLFPLALSIITLVIVFLLVCLDFALEHSWAGRPKIEVSIFGILSIFWLSFNAFSTVRWRQIPLQCSSIPLEFPDEHVWCRELQVLKSFVWINFLICSIITLWTLRYSIAQYNRGNKHVFQMPLSRYRPEFNSNLNATYNHGRGSEFLQFEKL